MTVKAELTCKKCDHKAEYSSSEIEYDHVVCKKCGRNIGVVKWIQAVNVEYIKVKDTVMRRDPKVHMSKKERRRMRDENK